MRENNEQHYGDDSEASHVELQAVAYFGISVIGFFGAILGGIAT